MASEPILKMKWIIRVYTSPRSERATCTITTMDREGKDTLLKAFDWPAGAPSPGQLQELVNFAVADLESSIVALIGVQGVLLR